MSKINVNAEFKEVARYDGDILNPMDHELLRDYGLDYLNTKEQVDVINAIRTLKMALETIEELKARDDRDNDQDESWTGKDFNSRNNDLIQVIKKGV